MDSTRQALLTTFSIIGFATLSWFFAHNPMPSDVAATEHNIDSWIDHLHMDSFDAQGLLQQTIVAKHLTHIPYHQQHRLEKPVITIHNKEGNLIHITAKYAHALYEFQKVTLLQQVLVTQSVPQKPDSVLHTEKLTYIPKTEQAHIHTPLIWTQANTTVHAQGMFANLKTNQIQLFQAKANYVPEHT
ncbi:MAG: LPS export ABC transporter periplasmic protein LptC [Legionellaceae bacterium]|nr:LPS export ABC transporter periplasmic protein LptC [Legionellaceae bacterium]